MDVTLTDQSARIVARYLETGRYRDAVEVLDAALSYCEATEARRDEKLAALRADIQLGIDEAAQGQLTDAEDFFAEITATYEERLSNTR